MLVKAIVDKIKVGVKLDLSLVYNSFFDLETLRLNYNTL